MVAYCVPAMLWLATNTTHVTVRLAGAIPAYRPTPPNITDEQWLIIIVLEVKPQPDRVRFGTVHRLWK